MSELDKSNLGKLGTKAKENCITICNWAGSCKTPEQFNTVEKFFLNHSWESNKLEDKDVQYYMGVCAGFIIALSKTKFKSK